MDGSFSDRISSAGETLSATGNRVATAADRLADAPARIAAGARTRFARMQDRVANAPGWFERHKAKFAGFAAGLVVPLVVLSLFTVSYRGYGLGENPPQPAQVYTAF